MKATAIIQARMGSTRLPGKVLREVAGMPLLALQVKRLQQAKQLDEVLLAIPDTRKDIPLADLANKLSIRCYRGSEEDVLDRFYRAAEKANSELIIRQTGDCPLADPALIDKAVEAFAQGTDYLSNSLERTYPRGLDIELFTKAALEVAHKEAHLSAEREHVTPFLYGNPERFRIAHLHNQKDCSVHRWTVDTPEDFQLIEKILEQFLPDHPFFSWEEVLEIVEQHPEWSALNRHINQKATY